MRYNIVAGEELKHIMMGMIDSPIPFNEDMSVGSYSSFPFSDAFINERSKVHHVEEELYRKKLESFLIVLSKLKKDDDIHLYFGIDKTCMANKELLINYFKGKVHSIILHTVDELTGLEIEEPVVY